MKKLMTAVLLVVFGVGMAGMAGCETDAQTGALLGSLGGAAAGAAIGAPV
jgi:hypothetical protein